MFSKVIVVSDNANIKPQKNFEFWANALSHCVPGRDTVFTKGPVDVLDHSAQAWSYGSKLILDGTTKWVEEGGELNWKAAAPRSDTELPKLEGILEQSQPGGGMWFVSVDKTKAFQGIELGTALAKTPASSGIRLICMVDDETEVTDHEDVFWTVLNNIDPERDCRILEGATGAMLVMDGTRKIKEEGFTRNWPDKITMPDDIVALVDAKWEKYGLGKKLKSPTGGRGAKIRISR